MTTLIRWNPFREMLTLQEQMDNLLGRSLNTFGASPTTTCGVAMDVLENDEAYIVTATLPGIHQEELDITLDQNVLTIKGEVMPPQLQENDQYHLRERTFGRFSRAVHLPTKLEPEAIEANLENGVLTITVPKAEESKPKRIHIGNGHQGAIEGSFVEEPAES